MRNKYRANDDIKYKDFKNIVFLKCHEAKESWLQEYLIFLYSRN